VTLRFTPAHRVNVMSQVTIKPVQADLGSVVQYVSEQYTGNQTSGLKLPEYAVWNLYATKKISWLTFKVGVDNVLERRYAQNATAGFAPSPDLYFPQPGRSFWGSVGVKFN
jgi:outer membrane receptor protein involved in Fe transport